MKTMRVLPMILQQRIIARALERAGIDADRVDMASLLDSSLTLNENRRILERELHRRL